MPRGRRPATNEEVDALIVERGLNGKRVGDVQVVPTTTAGVRRTVVSIAWDDCPHGPQAVRISAIKGGRSTHCKPCSTKARTLRESEASLARALDMEQHEGYIARLADVRPEGTSGMTRRWLTYTCPKGHEGEMSLAKFANQGSGCPSCANYGYDPAKPGSVYVVRGRGLVKVGISNTRRCLDNRLDDHRRQGLDEVLHLVHFEDGADAVALEQLWIEKRDTIPTEFLPTKDDLKDGYTEAAPAAPMVVRWIEQQLLPLAA